MHRQRHGKAPLSSLSFIFSALAYGSRRDRPTCDAAGRFFNLSESENNSMRTTHPPGKKRAQKEERRGATPIDHPQEMTP